MFSYGVISPVSQYWTLPNDSRIWEAVAVLGQLLAVGRTSKVFAYGNDAVAKVLIASVPDHWASVEAHLTEAVRSLGVPAPAVRDVTILNGRPAVIFDRVVGPSMWQQMIADPASVETLVAELAAVQGAIHSAGIPTAMPGKVARMSAKIAQVDALSGWEIAEAIDLVNSMPRGAALLHGDLHPGNILLGDNGPVVIDWFDASIGHPAADVVRSSLLLRADAVTDLGHLPDATPDVLERLRSSYLAAMREVIDAASLTFGLWEAVTAVSRLAEQTDADPAVLHAIWAGRPMRVLA